MSTLQVFNTIDYATLGDGCQIKDNRLYLQNIGCIKIKWHRIINGNVKTLSITKRKAELLSYWKKEQVS